MGFFDNIKDTINQKQADRQEHNRQMQEQADAKAAEILEAIRAYENNGSFFKSTNKAELLAFTKDFYDKIVLPASSVSKTHLTMHPYIDERAKTKLQSRFPSLGAEETVLIRFEPEKRQEFLITDAALYFRIAVDENCKFFAQGRIPMEEVSEFSIEQTAGSNLFKCDEYILATFAADKVSAEDCVSLNNYFKCILEHDFEITDEEVDALIREKIGSSVLAETQKYLVYDDERFVYFAWGLNSLTAKDYIFCTNKQIVIVDRELGGMTANVRQLYYEDITSCSTMQNAKSGDLAVDLISSAITSATKTCDLIISAAGANIKIDTLFKIEAERIVAVYHDFRKTLKNAAAQPQVIVQQTAEANPLEQLQKLAQLKDAGILTEEEFAAKKADLLAKM